MTTLRMPVIEPPVPPQAPAPYYAGLLNATSLTAASVAHNGVQITISNPSYGKLFAMTDGSLRFIPAGQPLFPGSTELASAQGNLSLQVSLTDVNDIRTAAGLPTVAHILYLNIRPASVRPALAALLPEVQALPEPELFTAWTQPSPPPDLTALANNYLDAVAQGTKTLLVSAGTFIGEAVTGPAPSTSAQFILRMVGPQKGDVSPVHHIRKMPIHGNGGAALWEGHPLIAAVSGISLPIDIFVEFEVWNLMTQMYEPLPAGVRVSLMDFDPISANDELGTQNTDAQGRVHFSYPNLAALVAGDPDDTGNPDLFFLVHTDGRQHAGHTLPSKWSTKGWKAADGISQGYYDDFDGSPIGKEDDPLVFRIGLDIHLQLEYLYGGLGSRNGTIEKASQGIPILLKGPASVQRGAFRTDADGQVHAVIFDIDPGTDLFFDILFEIEDVAIHLPRARVEIDPWRTTRNDADKTKDTHYPQHDRTSIGAHTSPASLKCTVEERNVALYFLKILRELSTFLFHVTGGAWAGIEDLRFFRSSISGHPYSWPAEEVNIPPKHHWKRDTIIHEISHQVMWKEVNFSSLGIAYEATLGNLELYHRIDLLSSSEHAFIEGWANFLAAVFAEPGNPPYSITTLVDTDGRAAGNLITTPLDGRGERVEGAFANGLWTVFRNHVVPSGVFSAPLVQESQNGNVTTTASWITQPAVSNNFLKLIWQPLKALAPLSSPTSTDMLAQIRMKNPGDWHKFLAELQGYNMVIVIPQITSLTPREGPLSGGQSVQITGSNFALGASVTFNGQAATSVVVNSSTSITMVTPPGVAGVCNVAVITRAGTGSLSGAYTYR